MKPARVPSVGAALIGCLSALAVGSCGLKGALQMPERSTNVVIRGPQSGPATTPPAGTSTTPAATPGESPATTPAPGTRVPVPADDDRMPPPPLPGGDPGSAHGG